MGFFVGANIKVKNRSMRQKVRNIFSCASLKSQREMVSSVTLRMYIEIQCFLCKHDPFSGQLSHL